MPRAPFAVSEPDEALALRRVEPRNRHDDALTRQPHAGKVFAIDGLGIRGLPCMPYRGQTPRFSDR